MVYTKTNMLPNDSIAIKPWLINGLKELLGLWVVLLGLQVVEPGFAVVGEPGFAVVGEAGFTVAVEPGFAVVVDGLTVTVELDLLVVDLIGVIVVLDVVELDELLDVSEKFDKSFSDVVSLAKVKVTNNAIIKKIIIFFFILQLLL